MKKLEDIPKNQFFEVPEGYFEKLPGIIQSRVTQHQEKRAWWPAYTYGLRYALPAVTLLVAIIFWFNRPGTEANAENILASIQTEDLITYLNEGDLTTDELLEDVELSSEDVSSIEESVYSSQFNESDIEEILNEIEP